MFVSLDKKVKQITNLLTEWLRLIHSLSHYQLSQEVGATTRSSGV